MTVYHDARSELNVCVCACNAAWRNPPAEVADIFARVLQRDTWGLRQVVIACLSTGDESMEKSPFLSHKSNYRYFAEALFPDTKSDSTKEDTTAMLQV